jgi:hypothetical protein
VLHGDLRGRGHVLWLEPAMRVLHLNVSLRSSWLRERFWGGRQFAAIRTREWPLWRRVAFAAAAPLIPVVRAWRTVPAWRRAQVPARAAPAFAIGLVLSAAGELVGVLAGPGGAPRKLFEIELHREAHTRA